MVLFDFIFMLWMYRKMFINMIVENYMVVDNKMGFLINVGYDKGFIMVMYFLIEIVNNVNMEIVIVVLIIKLISL